MERAFTRCINPANGELIGESPMHTPDEVKAIIIKARQAQRNWGLRPLKERKAYLRKLAYYISQNRNEIAEAIHRDNGKTMIDALTTELLPAMMALDYYIKLSGKFLKPHKLRAGNWLLAYKRSSIYRVPFGVVGIISPWNYPFAIPFSEVVMALLAGNSVLLKTATETQWVGRILEKVFLSANMPEGVFNYVNIGGRDAGKLFLAERPNGVDKLFFTGSVATGKLLMALAAKTLTPLSLELGGNDAMLVCDDADLDRTAKGAVWAGLSNAGQSCGGVERIYVHEKVYDSFLEKLKKEVERLRVGAAPGAFTYDMGAMSIDSQIEVVQAHIADALGKGAKIFVQSQAPKSSSGKWLPATVLINVNHTMQVMQDETFGPVLAIMKFQTFDEAIALANDSYLGLTASVWSKNRRKAVELGKRIQAGAITINDHLMSHGLAETPWGGFKESGIGRTHGKLGFDEMTEPQVIVEDILPFVKQNMWWQPYSKKVWDGICGITDFLYGDGIRRRLTGTIQMLKLFFRMFRRD
ncbi:MAG TPA: aldehyde dehydrogenase family protein [Candidatus Marinimicrobia bacterium]|nr:aldehyde dehydrogenase family protein [Candidatus Neomarinimicrobiota bacterium]